MKMKIELQSLTTTEVQVSLSISMGNLTIEFNDRGETWSESLKLDDVERAIDFLKYDQTKVKSNG